MFLIYFLIYSVTLSAPYREINWYVHIRNQNERLPAHVPESVSPLIKHHLNFTQLIPACMELKARPSQGKLRRYSVLRSQSRSTGAPASAVESGVMWRGLCLSSFLLIAISDAPALNQSPRGGRRLALSRECLKSLRNLLSLPKLIYITVCIRYLGRR